jgi:SP family sugar:H+ symporter-like MFS transporter
LFSTYDYQQRFGENGVLTPTRQSAITGLLSVGAVIGAVGAGSVADRIGLRVTCMIFIGIHLIGAAIEVSLALVPDLTARLPP